MVHSWGDPNFLDPRLHSCHFDADGNVWIASAPSGMVQKYTHDGSRLLLQIGSKGKLDSPDGTAKGQPLNSPAAAFFMPSSIAVDRARGDIYVSDGEGPGTNRRIAVLDRAGRFLRHWIIDDMESVHCLALGNEGFVYVCNRTGSEIRVYDKMGCSGGSPCRGRRSPCPGTAWPSRVAARRWRSTSRTIPGSVSCSRAGQRLPRREPRAARPQVQARLTVGRPPGILPGGRTRHPASARADSASPPIFSMP